MQRVEQKTVRRHEPLVRRGRRPRLDVTRREQGGNVDARETAGAPVVGKKHAAEVVLVDARANLLKVFKPKPILVFDGWSKSNLLLLINLY